LLTIVFLTDRRGWIGGLCQRIARPAAPVAVWSAEWPLRGYTGAEMHAFALDRFLVDKPEFDQVAGNVAW
jgi:hypothetical protein